MNMEVDKIHIKAEPLEEESQAIKRNHCDLPMVGEVKIKTEDGETIVIKKELEDDCSGEDENQSSMVFDFGPSASVHTEGVTESLLRKVLVDKNEDVEIISDSPRNRRFQENSITPCTSLSAEVKHESDQINEAAYHLTKFPDAYVRLRKLTDHEIYVATGGRYPEFGFRFVKTEEIAPVNCALQRPMLSNCQQTEKRNVAKSCITSSLDDQAKSSSTIKMVFDVSGKLKEWHVDAKKSGIPVPAKHLGKILMFADMMKEQNKFADKTYSGRSEKTCVEKEDAPEPPVTKKLKTILTSEEDGGEVEGSFVGHVCKICSKEYLSKHALTSHMKFHHLSLSGIPGSAYYGKEPEAVAARPVKPPPGSSQLSLPSSSKTIKNTTLGSARPLNFIATTSVSKLIPAQISANDGTKVKPGARIIKIPVQSGDATAAAAVFAKPGKQTQDNATLQTFRSDICRSKVGTSAIRVMTTNANVDGQRNLSSSVEVLSIKKEPGIKVEPAGLKETATSVDTNTKPVAKFAVKTISGSESFSCKECKFTCKTYMAFKTHIKGHDKENIYMCGICDDAYKLMSELKDHLFTHSNPNQNDVVMMCSVCDQEFESEQDLQLHLRTHYNVDVDTVFECAQCGKEFESQMALIGHMNKDHMREVEPFEPCKCGICLCSFFETADLESHIKSHKEKAPYNCQVCRCRFQTQEALNAHMPIHEKCEQTAKKIVPRWKCKHCLNRFHVKIDMINHIRFAHPEDVCYDCSFCESTFLSKEDLQRHIKTHSVVAHFL